MSRLSSIVLAAVLVLSWVVSALTASVLSPFYSPDERHHYSYVEYVAEHPTEFPPRYERMTTQGGDVNFLLHPPLYYQLMAVPFWMTHLDQNLTTIGRANDDGGAVSAGAMIPILRGASLLITGIYLLGLYLLIREVANSELVPSWAAVVAGVCLGFAPGFTFIGSALNNDVLALAVSMFVILFAVRFVRDLERRDLYGLVFFASAAVMTKATLWVLVAFAAISVVLRSVVWQPDEVSGARSKYRDMLARMRPRILGEWALAGMAFFAMVAAFVQVGVTWARYGSPQPRPPSVFRAEALESTVFSGSASIEPMGIVEFSDWALTLMFRSLFGVFTHNERFYEQRPSRLMYIVIAITVIAGVIAAVRLWRRRSFHNWLAAGLVGIWIAFLAVFLYRSYNTYHNLGTFGVHGRYTAGYIHAFILGAFGALTLKGGQEAKKIWRTTSSAALGVVAVVLAVLFADPFYYLSKTDELHARIDVPAMISDEAERLGLSPVELTAIMPASFVEHGADHKGGFLPQPRFLMAWSDSTVAGAIDLESNLGCVEVWVYGEGAEAWGQKSILEISVFEPTQDLSDAGATSIVSRSGELPAFPEVLQMTLDVTAYEGTEALFAIRHTNVRADGPPVLGWFGKGTRVVELFEAYSRPTSC